MAQVIKKATRESFGMALCELAKTNKDIIVFDADLAAATKTGIFKKEFPERFFDCGIAEGNMVGVAAGMAAAGKIPVAASFAMFATGRAFEQIRNSVAYPHLNVKIAGSHAGISTGEDGATHQCLEDIGIMRTIPGMVVLNPADQYEMMAATKAAIEYNGPVYIRLGRLAVDSFNDPDTYTFELGKGITLHEGNDVAVIATGLDAQQKNIDVSNAMAGFNYKPQTTYSKPVSTAPASRPVNPAGTSYRRPLESNVKNEELSIPTFLQKNRK